MENANKLASELTKLEYALIHSTWEPTQDLVEVELRKQKNLNPYNEPSKPHLLSTYEIVEKLKIERFTKILNGK